MPFRGMSHLEAKTGHHQMRAWWSVRLDCHRWRLESAKRFLGNDLNSQGYIIDFITILSYNYMLICAFHAPSPCHFVVPPALYAINHIICHLWQAVQ